ncbi:MAG TPA: hypothetical protein VLA99_05110 [Nitrospiraceae bacterium]|nr:hypothetical protein [Nitrospiraceae bacterium]
MQQDDSSADALILDLLAQDAAHPLTIEEVAAMLPELSWAELLQAVDRLSRRRRIVLSRQGFTYLLVHLTRSDQQAEVVMAGSAPDCR